MSAARKIADGLAAAEKGKADLARAQARIESDRGFCQVRKPRPHGWKPKSRRIQLLDQARRGRRKAERAHASWRRPSRTRAELVVQRARDNLRDEVAALAVKGAEQILRREIDARAHAELLARLKAQL